MPVSEKPKAMKQNTGFEGPQRGNTVTAKDTPGMGRRGESRTEQGSGGEEGRAGQRRAGGMRGRQGRVAGGKGRDGIGAESREGEWREG